jgi:hypothetical protein
VTEIWNAHAVLVHECQRKKPLVGHKRGWEDDIKRDVREIDVNFGG